MLVTSNSGNIYTHLPNIRATHENMTKANTVQNTPTLEYKTENMPIKNAAELIIEATNLLYKQFSSMMVLPQHHWQVKSSSPQALKFNKYFLREIAANLRDKGLPIYMISLKKMALEIEILKSQISRPLHVGVLVEYTYYREVGSPYLTQLIPVLYFLSPNGGKNEALIFAGQTGLDQDVKGKLFHPHDETILFTGELESLDTNHQLGNVLLLKHTLQDLMGIEESFQSLYTNHFGPSQQGNAQLRKNVSTTNTLPLEWTFGQAESISSPYPEQTWLKTKQCTADEFLSRCLFQKQQKFSVTTLYINRDGNIFPPIGTHSLPNGASLESQNSQLVVRFPETTELATNYLTRRAEKELQRIEERQQKANQRLEEDANQISHFFLRQQIDKTTVFGLDHTFINSDSEKTLLPIYQSAIAKVGAKLIIPTQNFNISDRRQYVADRTSEDFSTRNKYQYTPEHLASVTHWLAVNISFQACNAIDVEKQAPQIADNPTIWN